MTAPTKRVGCGRAPLAVLVFAAVLSAAAPAAAHVRVFVGGVVGAPWPHPYAPYYYYPPSPYPPLPESPPPGWVPGHWELRYDAWGRPYRAWIPPHLR